jgi:hypothetical protein
MKSYLEKTLKTKKIDRNTLRHPWSHARRLIREQSSLKKKNPSSWSHYDASAILKARPHAGTDDLDKKREELLGRKVTKWEKVRPLTLLSR